MPFTWRLFMSCHWLFFLYFMFARRPITTFPNYSKIKRSKSVHCQIHHVLFFCILLCFHIFIVILRYNPYEIFIHAKPFRYFFRRFFLYIIMLIYKRRHFTGLCDQSSDQLSHEVNKFFHIENKEPQAENIA